MDSLLYRGKREGDLSLYATGNLETLMSCTYVRPEVTIKLAQPVQTLDASL